MMIERVTIIFGILVFAGMPLVSYVEGSNNQMERMKPHGMMRSATDGRIPLGVSPEMKQHQLSNMRSHVVAVRTIIGFMAEGEFDKAAQTAHSRLGLTEAMKKMCSMFNNEKFRNLGLAFHRSGDALSDALRTKDIKKSLRALHATLGYCVQCHATFRQ